MKKSIKNNLIRFSVAAALLLLAAGLCLWASSCPGDVERYYTPFSRIVGGVVGRVWSVIPVVAAGELLFFISIAAALIFLVIGIFRRHFVQTLSKTLLVLSALALFFVTSWGLNYYKEPLSVRLGAQNGYTEQDLYLAADYCLDRALEYAPQVPRDENGVFTLGWDEVALGAREAVAALGEAPDALVSAPKALITSEGFSYLGILGIYNPFTGEGNVNVNQPDLDRCYSAVHELCHRLGYAPENEANYMAFVACAGSGRAAFSYSGWYNAFRLCYYKLPESLQETLREKVSEEIWTDLADSAVRYKKYEGEAQEAAGDINDGYLKFFGQESGVQSYGEAVDLIIFYCKRF